MDEVSNNDYTLNLLIQQWKGVYQHLNYLIDKRMRNNCLLNNAKSIQSQRCKSFKQIRLRLRNVDESSFLWKYYLPVQSHGNIYSCPISNEIYQQLTQHAVGNTPYITEGRQYTISIKMVVNFINLFCDKALKSVCFLYIKAGWHLLFLQHDDPLSLSKGYTFGQTKLLLRLKPDWSGTKWADLETFLTYSSSYK